MNASSVADPSVTRYHVQWLPEYCSHNETRGPEKSVTQVSSYPWALLCPRTPVLEKPALERSHNPCVLNTSQARVLNIVTQSCGEACAGQENTFAQTMVPGMRDHSPPAAPVTLLNGASLYAALEAEVVGEPVELALGFRLIGYGRDLAIYHIP